jgi:hypothetical protein
MILLESCSESPAVKSSKLRTSRRVWLSPSRFSTGNRPGLSSQDWFLYREEGPVHSATSARAFKWLGRNQDGLPSSLFVVYHLNVLFSLSDSEVGTRSLSDTIWLVIGVYLRPFSKNPRCSDNPLPEQLIYSKGNIQVKGFAETAGMDNTR